MVKILNLILYNPDSEYDDMRNIITAYLKTIDIQYYFYCYDQSIQDEHMIEGDLLKIKGVESYNPGITLKTIRALKISLKFDYDYILRSNISTIVNIARLTEFLEKNPIEYGGGNLLTLRWIDRPCGINDRKYWNTQYAQGTGIVLSRNSVRLFIDNLSMTDQSIIDDVCIGVFFNQMGIPLIQIGNNHSFVENAEYANDNVIFYRNRSYDRAQDTYRMRRIIDNLTASHKSSCKIFTPINEQLNERAYYGKDDRYIDVTHIFFSNFVKDSHLIISRNVSFNHIFGDPVYGVLKELVYRSNTCNIHINENRSDDVNICI